VGRSMTGWTKQQILFTALDERFYEIERLRGSAVRQMSEQFSRGPMCNRGRVFATLLQAILQGMKTGLAAIFAVLNALPHFGLIAPARGLRPLLEPVRPGNGLVLQAVANGPSSQTRSGAFRAEHRVR
jgi:hypothetical protein